MSEPTSEKLLPCPFCGGRAVMPYFGNRVECVDCEGSVMEPERWNTRADPERKALVEALERIKAPLGNPPDQVSDAEEWWRTLAVGYRLTAKTALRNISGGDDEG